jgi:hypothetical protein
MQIDSKVSHKPQKLCEKDTPTQTDTWTESNAVT